MNIMENKLFEDRARELYPEAVVKMMLPGDAGALKDYNKIQRLQREAYLRGLKECMPLVDAAKQLLHLHSCEQEGLLSGKPTFKMWFDAVNKLSEAVAAFPTNESKP